MRLRHSLSNLLVLSMATISLAQSTESVVTPAELMTDQTLRAITKGLDYLKSSQNDDGSFSARGYGRNVAVVSLAGMAFMSNGSTPERGPYLQQTARCLDYVLAATRESGYIIVPEAVSQGPMYGHGFATLFLAEAYGMSQSPVLRDRLAAAVKLIINSQNPAGGWRYQPESQDADISVTICQVMALRAARNAGIFVPNETIDRCIDYVKRSQNPDGGFMYMLEQPGESRFPRSAAGVVALYSAGIYEGPEVERGLVYLHEFLPKKDSTIRQMHFMYGHYYAAQAMAQTGGQPWKQWYTGVRDLLVAQQLDTGEWSDTIAPAYGTAMACIILQMPNTYLPIFQH